MQRISILSIVKKKCDVKKDPIVIYQASVQVDSGFIIQKVCATCDPIIIPR